MSTDATTASATSARMWKAYPEYADCGMSWARRIPASWESIKLKYLVNFLGGGTPSKDNITYWTGDIPWVSPKDMKSAAIEDSEDHISPAGISNSSTQLVGPGAVLLVVRSGILKHSIPVAVNAKPVALNQDMKALVPKGRVLANYLAYLIRGNQNALLVEWRKAGATVESIEYDLLANARFPLPPIPEQLAIVQFLDRQTAKIDTLIANRERLIELLEEKRAALISRAVTKGLDPSVPMKDSCLRWLGQIPNNWSECRLTFITSFITSGSRDWAEHYSDEGACFLRIGNLTRNSLNFDFSDIKHVVPPRNAEAKRSRVTPNDVLLSITAYIGSVGVAPSDIGEAYVNQHIALIRPNVNKLWPRWLGYSLLSSVGHAQLHILLYGGTKDGLGLDDVGNLVIPVPSVDEQARIVSYVDLQMEKTDRLVATIAQEIDRLKEYRTALISAAVTGKIDVREPRAEAGRLHVASTASTVEP